MNKNRKKLIYVSWKEEAKRSETTSDNFLTILKEFKKSERCLIDKFVSLRRPYLTGGFSLIHDKKQNNFQIRYRDENGYQLIETAYSFDLLWKIIELYPQLFLLY